MKTGDLFIKDMDEFIKYSKVLDNIIKSSNELPERVFSEVYDYFYFEEFDWAMTEEFSTVLKQLLIETNEQFLLIAVLVPNPSEYYFSEFGYYNWVKIPRDILDSSYYKVIDYSPEDSIADSILYNSQKIIWTIPSGKWAIWGDRKYGTCILGCKEVFQTKGEKSLKSWENVEVAMDSWMKLSLIHI